MFSIIFYSCFFSKILEINDHWEIFQSNNICTIMCNECKKKKKNGKKFIHLHYQKTRDIYFLNFSQIHIYKKTIWLKI